MQNGKKIKWMRVNKKRDDEFHDKLISFEGVKHLILQSGETWRRHASAYIYIFATLVSTFHLYVLTFFLAAYSRLLYKYWFLWANFTSANALHHSMEAADEWIESEQYRDLYGLNSHLWCFFGSFRCMSLAPSPIKLVSRLVLVAFA